MYDVLSATIYIKFTFTIKNISRTAGAYRRDFGMGVYQRLVL